MPVYNPVGAGLPREEAGPENIKFQFSKNTSEKI
jgi:hypothetical protein